MKTQWEGWSREDGTNTTWETSLPGDNDILQRYTRESSKIRLLDARKSHDIDMMKLLSYMPHALHTAENSVAYLEKKKRSQEPKMSWDPDKLYCKLKSSSLEPTVSEESNVERGVRTRKRRRSFSESNSNTDHLEGGYMHPAPLASQHQNTASSQTTRPKGRPSRTQISLTLRAAVQDKWNKSIRQSGAASVTIVNEVDYEASPTVGISGDFMYLEKDFLL